MRIPVDVEFHEDFESAAGLQISPAKCRFMTKIRLKKIRFLIEITIFYIFKWGNGLSFRGWGIFRGLQNGGLANGGFHYKNYSKIYRNPTKSL